MICDCCVHLHCLLQFPFFFLFFSNSLSLFHSLPLFSWKLLLLHRLASLVLLCVGGVLFRQIFSKICWLQMHNFSSFIFFPFAWRRNERDSRLDLPLYNESEKQVWSNQVGSVLIFLSLSLCWICVNRSISMQCSLCARFSFLLKQTRSFRFVRHFNFTKMLWLPSLLPWLHFQPCRACSFAQYCVCAE